MVLLSEWWAEVKLNFQHCHCLVNYFFFFIFDLMRWTTNIFWRLSTYFHRSKKNDFIFKSFRPYFVPCSWKRPIVWEKRESTSIPRRKETEDRAIKCKYHPCCFSFFSIQIKCQRCEILSLYFTLRRWWQIHILPLNKNSYYGAGAVITPAQSLPVINDSNLLCKRAEKRESDRRRRDIIFIIIRIINNRPQPIREQPACHSQITFDNYYNSTGRKKA